MQKEVQRVKKKYLPATLELIAFESADVITTSTPEWDNSNIDSGGWT